MEKISIQITIGRNFHFMAGSDQREYNHFNSIIDPVAKLALISGKTATSAPWADDKKGMVTWRPSLGNVYVSLGPDFKNYNTVSGAYKEAVRIKRLLQEKLIDLRKSYNNRHFIRRAINDHYSGSKHNIKS